MAEEAEGRLPIGGRAPAPPTVPASDDAARRVELLEKQHQDQEDYLITKENLEPPFPRTQTDLSGAVPRPAWDDRYRDELYSPIPACQSPTAWQ